MLKIASSSLSMEQIEYVFVYGTLRRDAATPMSYLLAQHCSHFADGYMQGRLYRVDGYPGAIESDKPKDRVYGEVYRLVNPCLILPELDNYEECTGKFPEPHEYTRKKLPITLIGGACITAWVYVYNHSVSNLMRIKSGDYLHAVSPSKESSIG